MRRAASILLALGVVMPASTAFAAPAATTTSLAVSGSSVAFGTTYTLTATVSTSVTVGEVKFCETSGTTCSGTLIVGRAQVVASGPNAGKASILLHGSIGAHTYKAFYVANSVDAASVSATATVTVTGSYPTTTVLAATGGTGNYSLAASVYGAPATHASSVPVTFTDTTTSVTLGTVNLPAATGLSFAQSSFSYNGNGEYGHASGDFNGDGNVDMVVVNGFISGSVGLDLLLGNGDGTFTEDAHGTFLLGTNTQYTSVTTGDFNRDGHLDMAVANGADGVIYILLGDGAGNFTQSSVASPQGTPYAIVAGDFNKDGILDLAVTDNG